jgi:hypothetical protein
MGMSGQCHAPAALYPRGKDPRYPLYRTLGGPQSRSGHRGYRKNPLPLPGIEPRSPGRPVRNQTLYWLSYPGILISSGMKFRNRNVPVWYSGIYRPNLSTGWGPVQNKKSDSIFRCLEKQQKFILPLISTCLFAVARTPPSNNFSYSCCEQCIRFISKCVWAANRRQAQPLWRL